MMAKSGHFDVVEPRTDYNTLIAESYKLLRQVVRARWGYAFEFLALLGPLEDIERACGQLRTALEHGLPGSRSPFALGDQGLVVPDEGGHESVFESPSQKIEQG